MLDMRAQVYVAELVPALLECMWHLSGAGSTILLAYYNRSASAHKAFWELFPSYFSWPPAKVPEESYGARRLPDDVGLFRLQCNDFKLC